MLGIPSLYSPLVLRGLEIDNRIVMAPMCQYSAHDGNVAPWHLRHYAERAIGGVGLILVEATAIEARGRISPRDLGLWNDDHVAGFRALAREVHGAGAKIGVQLAHAGRKGSTFAPWEGAGAIPVDQGGWPVVSASEGAFDPNHAPPQALNQEGIADITADFARAAQRAVAAGFDTVEIHAAHGYLLHQFLSPLTNHRTDAYGGSFENRSRLAIEVTRAIRRVVPETMPLLIRLSATDWVDGGWTIEQTIALLQVLKSEGVDFADISSGGLVPGARIPVGPGYQVPLSARVRRETHLPTGAVGLITDVGQAQKILDAGDADAILFGRLLLRDPYHPLRNAPEGHHRIPKQYIRAF